MISGPSPWVPWLERFERLCASHPGSVPWSVQVGHGPGHIVVGSCIHGVETGSLPAVVELLEELVEGAVTTVGTLTVFLGNPDAVRREVRFVEADLNRVFHADAPDSLEARRAAELRPLLASASLFFDFHQTMQPSLTPFFIFGWHEASYLWARLVGGSTVLVTRDGRQSFASGSLCGDEYCRQLGIPGITLELGEKGIRPEAARLCYTTLRALLDWSAVLQHRSHSLEQAASERPEFTFYETLHKEPFADTSATLIPGLHNFRGVHAGEVLGQSAAGPVRASRAGVILFPKYPRRDTSGKCLDPVAGDLFHIAAPLTQHPKDLWTN
ncbi:MAG: succinylglutamate desuccinylase/aspartoacylase family protein [Silvanigrellales bacterium]|nr:succinylglutamate desuccinylase/aspartoacylase family protein [Silvanigrellales bacterium]